jgi:hypothetical protein
VDVAQPAGIDKTLLGLNEIGHRALLDAHLKDPLVLAHGSHQRQALLGQRGHRLFDVNVLARLAGVDGNLGVGIVPGGHNHGVDVFAFQ